MKYSTSIALLILATALLVFILVFEKEQLGTRERFTVPPVSFETEAAELITITRAGETVSIRKDEGTWLVALPFEDRADQEACLDILKSLTDITILEVIDPGEIRSGNLDAHELSLSTGDGTTITVFGGSGPMASVRIGRGGALADTCYATFPDHEHFPDIYLLQSGLAELAARPVAALRDPKLFPMTLDEIGRVLIVDGASEELEIVRDARTRQWTIAKPFRGRAGQEAIDALVNRIRDIKMTAPVEDGVLATEKSFGTRSIALWKVPEGFASVIPLPEVGESPEGRALLEIAVPASSGGDKSASAVGRISGRDVLLRLPGEVSAFFEIDPASLRDPYLAQLPDRSIRGIVISSPGNPDVMLSSNGRTWSSLHNGEWEGADTVAVEQFMKALNEEKVLDHIPCEDPAGLEDYGLNPPNLRIGLTTSTVGASPGLEAGPKPGTADTGAPLLDEYSLSYVLGISSVQTSDPRDPSDPGKLYAKFADEPVILAIDPSFYNRIPSHPLKWRSRLVLHFNIISLREIRLIDSTSGSSLTRLTYDFLADDWQLHLGGEDLTDQLNPRMAGALVEVLTTLRARDWLANRDAALRALGDPVLSVEIDLAYASDDGIGENLETRTLRFAPVSESSADRLFYGRLDESPEIFLIERAPIDALRAPLFRPE